MEIERPTGPPTECAQTSAHPVLELLELGTVEERTKEFLLLFWKPAALEPMECAQIRPSAAAVDDFDSPYRLLVSENDVPCLTTAGAIITSIIDPDVFLGSDAECNHLPQSPAGPKLFVREHYIGLYENMMTRKSHSYQQRFNFRCLLTGNPGIEKTMYLIYFMMRVMHENRGNPKFRMAIVTSYANSGPSYYTFTRKSGWFKISEDRFIWFRKQRALDADSWLFADSFDVPNCRTNGLLTASPNKKHYKFYAQGQIQKLYMPLWTLNELIYVFRKIIKPARPGDSGETPSAAPIVGAAADPAAGWKAFLKERETCQNPVKSPLPDVIDQINYRLDGETERELTENKVIIRFFVWGGVPRTVYFFSVLPDMWKFILSSNWLTGQVLEQLYRGTDSSATFSMKQDDAEHQVVTYVIDMTDDPMKKYEWVDGAMFKTISEYAWFLMGEKFKQRSLYDDFFALPGNEVGIRQGDHAVFERLCHKYLAGSGSITYFAYERSLAKPIVRENEEEVARVLELPQMSGPRSSLEKKPMF